MEITRNAPGGGITESWNGQASHLRLVRSTAVSIAPRSKAFWSQSSIACPSRLHLVGARVARAAVPINQQRRPSDRREEGREMESIERFIYSVSRFVFGLGVGLALTSVYVIVTSAPDLMTTRSAEGDVVLLEPVVVTISKERFESIRAEAEPVKEAAHPYGAGPKQV